MENAANKQDDNLVTKKEGEFMIDANIFVSLKNKPITDVYKIK